MIFFPNFLLESWEVNLQRKTQSGSEDDEELETGTHLVLGEC